MTPTPLHQELMSQMEQQAVESMNQLELHNVQNAQERTKNFMDRYKSSKQPLGKKKRNKVQALIGFGVRAAYVSGAWKHGWVEAWISRDTSYLVNMKTGDFALLLLDGEPTTGAPLWRKHGCCA